VIRGAARAAVVVCFVAEAGTAAGAGPRVVVVDDGDRGTRVATERLRGELAAAGFDVAPRAPRGADAREDVEGDDAIATVRLVRNPQTHGTEMWVSDRLTGKTLVRRVNADPERAPRLVALRGVELLRASLLELAAPPHDDAPPQTPALAQPPPPEVARLVAPVPPAIAPAPARPEAPAPVSTAHARWVGRVAIEAGVTVLASTDHLGPAAAPSLGLWVALPASFAVRVQLVGPALTTGLVNAAGSAEVRQELASIDLAWAPELHGPVSPFLALGAGPYHLHVQGTASAPFHSAASDDWAAAFAGGLGVAIRLAPQVAIAAEARAVALTPHPTVSIGSERVASAGSPSLLGSASLVASF